MIDLVTMSKTSVPEHEVTEIVKSNRLQTNSKAGIVYYDNINLKFADGFYLRIETSKNNRLKLECSLHKFYNYMRTGLQTNFDIFSFDNARNSIELLSNRIGINLKNAKINYYEVGLNLTMNNDCHEYINEMQAIGILENKRKLFINPKYKGERIKTTTFHRDIRKVYKVYDKIHEMRDKKREEKPSAPNILRIETTYRRVENMTVSTLLHEKTVRKIATQFLKDWRTVQFSDFNVKVKKGTHQRKIDLIKEIIIYGEPNVLKQAKQDYKDGKLTERRYRDKREFIQNEWRTLKHKLKLQKSENEREYRNKLNKALNMLHG